MEQRLHFLTGNYGSLCVLMFLGVFANTLGNSIFNASLMLALPEENRGGILGLVGAATSGGCVLSAVIYGVLCDLFPVYLVFIAGFALSAVPMVYLCVHQNTGRCLMLLRNRINQPGNGFAAAVIGTGWCCQNCVHRTNVLSF